MSKFDIPAQVTLIRSELAEALSAHLMPVLEARLKRQAAFYAALQTTWESGLKPAQDASEVSPAALKAWHIAWQGLSETWKEILPLDANDELHFLFPDFHTHFETLLQAQQLEVNRPQLPERFQVLEGDKGLLPIKKRGKRFLWHFTRIPVRFANVFRKQPKPVAYWNQQIPFRALVEDRLRTALNEGIAEVADLLEVRSSEALEAQMAYFLAQDAQLRANWEDTSAPSSDVLPDLPDFTLVAEKLQQNIETLLFNTLEAAIKQIEQDLQIVNTQELPGRTLSDKKLSQRRKQVESKFRKRISAVRQQFKRSVLKAEYESWLHRVICIERIWLFDFRHDTQPAFFTPLLDAQSAMIELVNTLATELEDQSETEAKLKKWVQLIRPQLRKKLVKGLIVPAKNHLSQPGYSRALGAPLRQVEQELVSAPAEFQTHTPASTKTTSVRLFHLLQYEVLATCSTQIGEVRNSYLHESMKLGQAMEEVGQIALYNLDIAEDAIDNKEIDLSEAVKLSGEGFQRAINRAEAAKAELEALWQSMDTGIGKAGEELMAATLNLTDLTVIGELETRIRRKGIVAAGSTLQSGTEGIMNRTGKAADQTLRSLLEKAKQQYQVLREKLGLAQAPPGIQTEISDFLAESANAITQLPFVYQRLFADEPVKDQTFFEGRAAELTALQHAFANFKKGRFAPTIIVGEPEGGKTSLINIFLETTKKKPKVIRLSTEDISREPGGLITALVSAFRFKMENPTAEALAERINGLRKPRIVIVDPLEQLFLKQVGGFENLKDFARLISSTGKTVFWLAGVSAYSWEFFNKTMGIEEYVAYLVQLENFNSKELENSILRRHGFSGYQLHFEPGPSLLANKTYQKLPEQKKQAHVRQQFFNRLRSLSGNNLSVAFLFWLRSVSEKDTSTLEVRSLETIDLEFLAGLPTYRWLALHSLLLHGNLTRDEYQQVFRTSREKCGLDLSGLLDDGLVIERAGKFANNPLLQSKVIEHLKTKNFLH